MKRVKTSVYISEDFWREFKKYAALRGREVSELLEEIIKEELMLELEEVVSEFSGEMEVELDFRPVKPKAPVSELVREMRSEREASLLR